MGIKSQGIKVCANGAGNLFSCGPGFKCCGDVCTVEDGPCCTNSVGYKFGCGQGSSCCGNACAAPGSKCCASVTDGYKYPVTLATQCSDELSVKCINTHGDSFLCEKIPSAVVTSVSRQAAHVVQTRWVTTLPAPRTTLVAAMVALRPKANAAPTLRDTNML